MNTALAQTESADAVRSAKRAGPSRSSSPVVQIARLGFQYSRGLRILDDVSLDIESGQVHCLLGPSGCGKTTLLRLLAGLECPGCGTIDIDGVRASQAGPLGRQIKPERRGVGYVSQDFALFPHLNVLKNITFGMAHLPRAQRRGSAVALLEKVGMAEYAHAMPHTLSGGQQQRVAVARALGRKPRLMLLDEPFTSLDTTLREEVRDSTLGVLRDAGVATLMVTHDPAEALAVGDVVSVMRCGRLIVTAAPPESVCVLEPRPKGPPSVRLRLDPEGAASPLTQ